jgi:hypothetical protein
LENFCKSEFQGGKGYFVPNSPIELH